VTVSRRDFVKTSVLGAVAAGVGDGLQVPSARGKKASRGVRSQSDSAKRPIIICANNGYAYVERRTSFSKVVAYARGWHSRGEGAGG